MAVTTMERLNEALDLADHKQAVQLVKQYLSLLGKEGLATPSVIYRAEFTAFQACKLDQLHVDARRWLERSYKHAVMAGGPDTPFAENAAMYLAQPVDQVILLVPF